MLPTGFFFEYTTNFPHFRILDFPITNHIIPPPHMASKKKKENPNKTTTPSLKKKKSPSKKASALDDLKNYWSQKSPVLKFLLGFAGCMILFYILYLSPFFVEYFVRPLLNFEAKVGSLLLNIFGQGTVATNDIISGGDFSVSIKNGCDGLETLAIMLSGIIVFPLSFKYKWPGLLYGTLALFVLNFIRISALFVIGKNFSEGVFDFFHEQGGFVIFTMLGVLLWIVWANWALNKKAEELQSENKASA